MGCSVTAPVLIADVLGDLVARLGQPPVRHPVIRTGDRQEIPYAIRNLVWRRDGKRCVWCGSTESLNLDHILPWSAGGTDDPTNLRVLCQRCNEDRSNYALPGDDERPRLAVVWTCVPCELDRWNRGRDWDKHATPEDRERLTAWCGCCESASWTYAGCQEQAPPPRPVLMGEREDTTW